MEIELNDLLDHAEEAYQIYCRQNGGALNLNAKNSCGDPLLHPAVGLKCSSLVKHLVSSVGLDINAQGDFHETPYCLASSLGHQCMMQLLLDLGADPTIANHLGEAPKDLLGLKNPSE